MSERHIPVSHPALRHIPIERRRQAIRRLVARDEVIVREFLDREEAERTQLTATLEEMARLLQRSPERPYTVEQRGMAILIAGELRKRSREETQQTHEGYYARPRFEATEKRYAAIAEVVEAEPRKRLEDIAQQFGVSKSLVSKVAIARGIRRRVRLV